ncbi:hypothetical protein Bca52824_085811 [Brassica carinata]|uniref:RNA-dependent RNA polymerase n=1 Tax=Brassica carinata TaxID=52824 RepID=A0A8X7P8G5_BRACI|nr:hypothetical protein Bca52824_085811 [Brassica carinata]
MFAPRDGIKAEDIKSWMEDFGNIKNVVKYTLTIMAYDVELFLMWISSSGTHYVFSDGIGKISSEFAELMARKCDIKGFSPSAFRLDMEGVGKITQYR